MSWEQLYKWPLEASEDIVNLALDTQQSWSSSMIDAIAPGKDTPAEMTEWYEGMSSLLINWNQAQRDIWQNWFTTLKQFEPTMPKATSELLERTQPLIKSAMETANQVVPAASVFAPQAAPENTDANAPAPAKKATPPARKRAAKGRPPRNASKAATTTKAAPVKETTAHAKPAAAKTETPADTKPAPAPAKAAPVEAKPAAAPEPKPQPAAEKPAAEEKKGE